MRESDPNRPAIGLQSQSLHQAQSVVVAVPAADSVTREVFGSGSRRQTRPGEGYGRHTLTQPAAICYAVDLYVGYAFQTIQQSHRQRLFVLLYRAHGGFQSQAIAAKAAPRVLLPERRAIQVADTSQVLDSSRRARDALMILRAGLPTMRRDIACRAHFVRLKPTQVLRFAPDHTEMRAEELIGRAGQKIAVQLLHIHRAVRHVLYGIHIDERPYLMRHSRDCRHIRNSADSIGRMRNGHQPRPRAQGALHVRSEEHTSELQSRRD